MRNRNPIAPANYIQLFGITGVFLEMVVVNFDFKPAIT